MDSKAFDELLKHAKDDPQFFHSLVFDPEKVIASLVGVDRRAKGAIIALRPEELIGRMVGEVSWCDVTCTSSCGVTCNDSCGYTTNLQAGHAHFGGGGGGPVEWCDVTCTSSCGGTCTGSSCGYTTNLTARFRRPGMTR